MMQRPYFFLLFPLCLPFLSPSKTCHNADLCSWLSQHKWLWGPEKVSRFEFLNQKWLDFILLQDTHTDGTNEAGWYATWSETALLNHSMNFTVGIVVPLSVKLGPTSAVALEAIPSHLLIV